MILVRGCFLLALSLILAAAAFGKVPELGKEKKKPLFKASHRARTAAEKEKALKKLQNPALKNKTLEKYRVQANGCNAVVKNFPASFSGHSNPANGEALEPALVEEVVKKYSDYLWNTDGFEARFYLEFPSEKQEDLPASTVLAALAWHFEAIK